MTVTGSVSSHLSPSMSMMGCSGEADEAVAGSCGTPAVFGGDLQGAGGFGRVGDEFDADGAEEGVVVVGGVLGGLLGELVGEGRRGSFEREEVFT